jgi:DNA-binding protein
MTEKTDKLKKTEEKVTDANTIYVGSKPPMSYVIAVVTQFNNNSCNKVIIKARGRAISNAVDTAEIVKNRFMKDVKINDLQIGTESLTNEEGRTLNVSSIEICLLNNQKSNSKKSKN